MNQTIDQHLITLEMLFEGFKTSIPREYYRIVDKREFYWVQSNDSHNDYFKFYTCNNDVFEYVNQIRISRRKSNGGVYIDNENVLLRVTRMVKYNNLSSYYILDFSKQVSENKVPKVPNYFYTYNY